MSGSGFIIFQLAAGTVNRVGSILPVDSDFRSTTRKDRIFSNGFPRDDYTYHRGGFRGQAVQLIPASGRSVARTGVLRDDPLSMKPSYRFLDITPRKINIVLALDGF